MQLLSVRYSPTCVLTDRPWNPFPPSQINDFTPPSTLSYCLCASVFCFTQRRSFFFFFSSLPFLLILFSLPSSGLLMSFLFQKYQWLNTLPSSFHLVFLARFYTFLSPSFAQGNSKYKEKSQVALLPSLLLASVIQVGLGETGKHRAVSGNNRKLVSFLHRQPL